MDYFYSSIKAAFNKHGYNPEKTLDIAEELYDKHKCLSYPRTPSRVMGDNNVELFREKFELLKDSFPELSKWCNPANIDSSNRRLFNSADLEAHHALIPLDRIPGSATEEERNVYMIVAESFFLSVMDDYKYNQKSIIFDCGEFSFKAVVNETVQQGWKAAKTKDEEDGEEDDEQEVAAFDENDCSVSSLKKIEKMTKPKKEYTIASLLTFMEYPKGEGAERLAGLGTPATRATIIEKLFKQDYVVEQKKKLFATEKGMWLLRFLSKDQELKKIANVDQTTAWENELAQTPDGFEENIRSFVRKSIRPEIKEVYEEIVGQCPVCGKRVVGGKMSYSCEGWKDESCDFKIWKQMLGAAITLSDCQLLMAGKKTAQKTMKSKAGKTFKAAVRLNAEYKTELVFDDKKKPAGTKKGFKKK